MEDKRLEKRKEFLNPAKNGREKRAKYMVELRKKRKQEMFRARRKIGIAEESKQKNGLVLTDEGRINTTVQAHGVMLEYSQTLHSICPLLFQEDIEMIDKLNSVKEALEYDDHDRKAYIALWTYLRIFTSLDDRRYVETIINANLYPLIMKMASAETVIDLMTEITWILTNMTAVENKEIMEYLLKEEFGLLDYWK